MFGGRGYVSTMKITGTHLYFKKQTDVTKVESELWENISLFSIKFVIAGYHSEFFIKKKSRVDLLSSFEIVTEEGYSILFEVLKKKDEREIRKKEFMDNEIDRIMKYTPEKLREPGFKTELEKKYKEMTDATNKKKQETNEANKRKNQENELAGIEERLPVEEDETEEEMSLRRQRYCELIVGGLKAVVDEIRGSKVFMGPDGVPQRRKDAKVILKKTG